MSDYFGKLVSFPQRLDPFHEQAHAVGIDYTTASRWSRRTAGDKGLQQLAASATRFLNAKT